MVYLKRPFFIVGKTPYNRQVMLLLQSITVLCAKQPLEDVLYPKKVA